MRRLCTLLGMPQNRFASIHVVGTNGKTSVTRMTAALLEAHGVSAGAYLSPHIHSWRERVMIRGEPISEEAFTDALERAEQSAEVADRAAGDEGPVTQFELLTARGVRRVRRSARPVRGDRGGPGGPAGRDQRHSVAAHRADLGRLDHTEWLGETLEEIAAEKLAVLRDHTTLIVGDVPAEVGPVIAECRWSSGTPASSGWTSMRVGDPVTYRDRNLALAESATEQALGRLDPDAVLGLQAITIPGRAELVAGDPPQIFDAAHNPDGARALAEALPGLAGGREVVCCLAVLEGKDAGGIINPLAGACSQFVCTEIPPDAIEGSGRPGGRARPALELAALCEKAGVAAEAVPDPIQAWERARELAAGRDGVALAAGSHYLLSCIWTERPAQSS